MKRLVFSTLLAVLSSPALFAADPTSAEVNALRRLELQFQQHITSNPQAWRSSTQVCGNGLGVQHCQSMEGSSTSVGVMEGAQVGYDRDANGRTQFGVGVEYTTPGLAGVTVSGTRFPATGNEQYCAGVAVGAGLGLAVCSTIIRSHRGRLVAENLPSGGAAISFELPISN